MNASPATSQPVALPSHLDPVNGPVWQSDVTGRWFITAGNPGFNCSANNRRGFETKAAALKAVERFTA
jgi:hypothetical protein